MTTWLLLSPMLEKTTTRDGSGAVSNSRPSISGAFRATDRYTSSSVSISPYRVNTYVCNPKYFPGGGSCARTTIASRGARR
jgi:hypothetical protein